VAPPPLFFAYLTGATLAYLALVEIVKAFFYRAMVGRSPQGRHGQL
jgi:Mg2+-importing ATPase